VSHGASAGPAPTIEALGDSALLLRFGEPMATTATPATNAQVHALAARLQAARPGWLLDLVPAYASLGVCFDLARIEARQAQAWIEQALRQPAPATVPLPARCIEIPLVYGGEYGPDLDAAAAELGLTPAQLAARHAAGDYRVAMLGFAPGFPYLLGLDPALALPRLATPRTRVAAGSVGIGGAQTGIYPCASPGGWRLLGRTPLALFDPQREPPALLAPGDRVRFVAINARDFAPMPTA
jgi:KipI family sensor histidine kinase inhibitor